MWLADVWLYLVRTIRLELEDEPDMGKSRDR